MLGVDLGSSLTKLALIESDGTMKFEHFRTKFDLIEPYFTNKGDHSLKDFAPNGVKRIGAVGAGSCKFSDFLRTLPVPPENGDEMKSNAFAVKQMLKDPSKLRVFGGTGKVEDRFVIASMGTGVSFTVVAPDEPMRHVNGSAVGGGTLLALSKLILNINDFDQLCKLAAEGDSNKLDLLISDVFGSDYGTTLKADVIASSMAKAAWMDERPADKDIAASILATISFSIGQHVSAICGAHNIKTCVFVGGFLDMDGIIAKNLQRSVNLFHPEITLVIPQHYHYIGALGAALRVSQQVPEE